MGVQMWKDKILNIQNMAFRMPSGLVSKRYMSIVVVGGYLSPVAQSEQ